jgi:hypothetical protein
MSIVMKEIINYPTTKTEWQEWLEDIENQLLEQGRIVDALLVKKRDQIRDIINTWEDA